MESKAHKHLKTQALYWLKGKMTDLCANEVKLFVHRKRFKADAVGINLKRKEVRIIEVKVTRSDFLRDDVLHSDYGYHQVADYAYLLTPKGLLKLDEIPKGYGLLEIDEFDSITVIKNPSRNQTPKLSLDTFIKRTGRAATNAVLFQELSKETKDKTGGAFSRGATIQLISATCPSCKKRKKYLIQIDQKEVLCEGRGCKTEIPLSKARTHIITSYNKNFVKKINKLMENE